MILGIFSRASFCCTKTLQVADLIEKALIDRESLKWQLLLEKKHEFDGLGGKNSSLVTLETAKDVCLVWEAFKINGSLFCLQWIQCSESSYSPTSKKNPLKAESFNMRSFSNSESIPILFFLLTSSLGSVQLWLCFEESIASFSSNTLVEVSLSTKVFVVLEAGLHLSLQSCSVIKLLLFPRQPPKTKASHVCDWSLK